MDVFQCYTPTNDRDEQDKEDFYSLYTTDDFSGLPKTKHDLGLKRCFSAYAPHVTWPWEGGFPLTEGIQKATWISPDLHRS